MIDKADFRVPGEIPFTREFNKILEFANRPRPHDENYQSPFRKSRFYAAAIDCTEFNLPVMLHLNCKMTKKSQHKIEILQTGEKSFSEIRDLLSQVFRGYPETYGVLRLDLTADVPDVPVQWFKEHTYVAFKQTRRELGQMMTKPYQCVRKGNAETIYSGVKPNQLRIYDKTAERMVRWRQEWRRFARGQDADEAFANFPSFEQRFGHSPDRIITRVERQCSGRDLKNLKLTTLLELKEHGPFVEPFSRINFFDESDRDLSPEIWGFRDWCAGMYLRDRARADGLSEMRKFMQRELKSNFSRSWNHFEPFFCAEKKIGITRMELRSNYASSTMMQLSA